ncbi:Fic family protein [Methylomicrobium lacus]|uniref:Fic family protein n=1 Tax=Methylomicrobium lacus TaxID=136992 RepID=UPI0035A8F821
MKYREISNIDKLDRLQTHFAYSTKLAEAIGVSRRSLLNWRDRPESIKPEHRLDIDVLYCRHILIPEWDNPRQTLAPVLLPDDMPKNEALFMPFLRRISYGTIEIETDMTRADFDKVIDEEKLPKNMDRQTFHEAINTFFTHRWLWRKIVEHGESMTITEESIKSLHVALMRGVHENAGFYSDKIRVMGKLADMHTTLPEDIPEEVNRWVYKMSGASNLEEIARAHAWFIAIHPFGDGNGRVGRALVMAQCLNARLMPPVFDGENRAMYYAAMEHAMVHGRYAPLVRLFHEAALRGKP